MERLEVVREKLNTLLSGENSHRIKCTRTLKHFANFKEKYNAAGSLKLINSKNVLHEACCVLADDGLRFGPDTCHCAAADRGIVFVEKLIDYYNDYFSVYPRRATIDSSEEKK